MSLTGHRGPDPEHPETRYAEENNNNNSDDAGNADAGNNFIWLIWLLLDEHNNLFILTLLIYHNKRMRTKNTAISDLLAAVGIKITLLVVISVSGARPFALTANKQLLISSFGWFSPAPVII
ncbi:hypothetical protein ACJX0J_016237, partial [Zea mays]